MPTPIFTGFNFQRTQDPTKSAKDAFGAAAQASGQMPTTHDEAAAWFGQYAQPALEQQGYKVFEVQGDKARVGSREDPEGRQWVDFLQNAGGSNPAFQWHVADETPQAVQQALAASPTEILSPGNLGHDPTTQVALTQALGSEPATTPLAAPTAASPVTPPNLAPTGTIQPLNLAALRQGLQGLLPQRRLN